MIQEFIQNIETELEIPTGVITPDTQLGKIPQLDSMGKLLLILMIDTKYGYTIEAEQINTCDTISELHDVISKHTANYPQQALTK